MMVDKKKPNQQNPEPCRNYKNELSLLSDEKANEVVGRSLKIYYVVESLRITNTFEYKINEFVEAHMYIIDQEVQLFLKKPKPNEDELTVESIYSGMAGIALLYNFYANKTQNKNKTIEAKLIIEKCISILDENSDSVTYLTGKSGIFVTATEIYRDLGDIKNAKKMIEKVVDLLPLALNQKMPDVLLYGRAGYLYSLLILKKLGWEDPDRDRLIRKVVTSIFNNGIQTCDRDKPRRTSLMYKCHNKKYLGAAQGLSGVIHCLLLAKSYLTKSELDDLIKPALDYLLTLRYKSGNLPVSLCSDPDRLVQWCHGASGVTHTYVLAYKVFLDEKYLNAAVQYADIVWKRGLLTKGYGLCHGVSGNSYAFMSLFQLTGKTKYLYRAARFVDWCLTTNRQNRIPDNPYSMFEGVAGVTYALMDVQDPIAANIPGF
ncbi:lanC-like protein 2 isoform X1 [Metopolophium dirhodum]|uniref:lanC-like protein 2 isoform X1 n=1 Tax=Metopolophium dirhodum TaxID=44670 RepID=UPI0029902F9F|nr:lanC-like protein 2 isoform X1 [Metopolophium dirhodum]XP_060855741.1 lanC-like protein 2 isoform X1 [Metopolophium dirhodum]XP_060855742.1 lanC-like protein 2 isoform X1 [Metopolophium dirhodum]